jgi:hypothetical protein
MSHEDAQKRNSHKEAQKAHKEFALIHFVLFVPFCG